MGSAKSKPMRHLPKSKPQTWAGARTPLPSQYKNTAILQDSKDPHLLANLSKIGPAQLPHVTSTFRPGPSDAIYRSMQARQASEDIASSSTPVKNHLLVQSFADLLEERKSATSPSQLVRIAKKFDIEISTLDKVARYVNSPSLGPTVPSRNVNADGERALLAKAVWVDPSPAS